MDRPPDRERFFKYVSASTAIKVLERSAVRYSSPLIFNDPFDIQSGLHFPFDIGSFPQRVIQRIRDIVTASTRPEVDEEDDWGKAIILMWENKGKREMPEFFLRRLVESFGDRIALYQAQCQQLWGVDFLPRLRVFSVTEEPDNLLMWSHYTQNHTGAVFAFRVLVKEDSALGVAKPVIYRSAPPPLFSEEEWIGFILGTRPLDPNEQLFLHYAYIKSDIWAYEKEWRVWLVEPQPQQELFTDYQLLREEVEAVYLGCKMDSKDKEAIKTLLSARYPQAQIFQGCKPVSEYRLHFDKV
jgi:hypothetical protein